MDFDLLLLSNLEHTQKLDSHHPDDLLVVSGLFKEGLRSKIIPWENGIDTYETGGVLFRTTWGYHYDLKKFKNLLSDLSRSSSMIWNPLKLIRWNLHKKYLLELARSGSSPIVPTKMFRFQDFVQLQNAWEALEAESLVLKPAVAASAHNTFHIDIESQPDQLMSEVKNLLGTEILVQKFMPKIAEEGEYSLIFIEAEFTHCILKTPKQGDFRVQEEHGGESFLSTCPPQALRTAKKILSQLAEEPLYARVDLVRDQSDSFLLMELELIEPDLFLRYSETALERLVQALSKRL